MENTEHVALSNCDSEPVHIPGRIQSFGAMLAFNINHGHITHYSDNLRSLVFRDREVKLGQQYDDFLTERKIIHAVRGAVGLPTIRSQRDRTGNFQAKGLSIDLSTYVTGESVVVEFEPETGVFRQRPQSSVSMVRSIMSSIDAGHTFEDMLTNAANALRHVSGHDRVMVYRFLKNGDGEVVAESKGPGIEPYLGLRYPAWDIPTQVRQIMLRSPFRIIEDIAGEPAQLVTDPEAGQLDLTFSHLRGVSPIHIEYLRNMGVRSTMNVSIIVRGRMWGLFAFHHYRPRKVPPDQRTICELFGNLFSMKIQQEEEKERIKTSEKARSLLSAITSEPMAAAQITSTHGAALQEVIGCDGVAYVERGKVASHGEAPAKACILETIGLSNEDTVAIDNLSATELLSKAVDLGKTAGALIFRMAENSHLLFFRNEIIHEVRWAGGKDKVLETGPNGPRLLPRGSFNEYTESVSGFCRPWTQLDIEVAAEARRELMKSMFANSTELTFQWEKQKKYQDLLIAELNHRVRNTIALVRSIARQTKDSSQSLEQYVDSLEQRIGALSLAHDLVGGSGHQWAKIEELLRGELRPYDMNSDRISTLGPPLAVRADVAPILSLLFHEMTSNAVKYGALSEKGVSLSVQWFEDSGGISIVWNEKLTEEVRQPERQGFGLALIKRSLPYECNGNSEITYSGNEFRIKFWLPADSVIDATEIEDAKHPKTQTDSATNNRFENIKSALVVEDNMVLAMELERMLSDMGVDDVQALPNSSLAFEAMERQKFDCAILDINLGNENSFELGIALLAAGIPIVLASGYDNSLDVPIELANVPRVVKPIGRLDISVAIAKAVDSMRGDTE